jgi:hypothetical protein
MPGDSARRADQSVGIVLERVALIEEIADAPSHGDVLITTEGGRHLLSVVPHPHRLSLSDYAAALQIARRWAEANKVAIWRANGGVFTKLSRD